MRKFNQPFDSYEIGLERPIAVELNPKNPKFKHLVENPIYYSHAFQYTLGDFYRSIWGYENIWDRELETKLIKSLDHYLHQAIEKKKYYFESLTMLHPASARGVIWRRGIKPKRLNFFNRKLIQIPLGSKLTARVNLLDSPHHVDLEFNQPDGTTVIFSIQYIDYYTRLRSMTDAKRNQSEPVRTNEKDGKRREADEVKSFGREDALKALASQLPRVRQRIRRAY